MKKIFHSHKNRTFPKGLTHPFGKKNAFFFSFFVFGQNNTKNKI